MLEEKAKTRGCNTMGCQGVGGWNGRVEVEKLNERVECNVEWNGRE